MENPFKILLPLLTTWLTAPMLNCPNTSLAKKPPVHSPVGLWIDIRRQLLLGGRKTLSKALNQTLELEAADIAAGTPTSRSRRIH
jgi:hypothetical protein